MSENPPPYGDDRQDYEPPADMPVPPEMDAPPAPLPPQRTSTGRTFWVWFLVVTVLNSIPVLGLLTGSVCILVGLIGAAASKDPSSRTKFGAVAAGGAVGMVVSAGICISQLSGGGI